MNDFEITKREILFSINIIAIMFIIGLVIHGKINDDLMEKYQIYDTAVQISNDKSAFEYGMKTDIGYAFVYGELKAIDIVTYKEIGGKYSYIEKIKERYTQHTRTVKKTNVNPDGTTETYTTTETYYSWDRVNSDSKHSEQISFLDVEFSYADIDFPKENYIDTIYESSDIRYVYYGTAAQYTGTIFTELKNNTINNSEFYVSNIDDTIQKLESKNELIGFWIIWILLVALLVFGFYIFENNWLED